MRSPGTRKEKRTRGWILLDYVDVVAHVFLRDVRTYYGLDQLWADAIRNTYENVA
jgi:ribosome-associated protein